MGCDGILEVQAHGVALSSNLSYLVLTRPVPVVGMDTVRIVERVLAASNDTLQVQPFVQFAAVRERKWDAPILKDQLRSPSSGVLEFNTGDLSIASDAAAKLLVRFGLALRYNPSGGSQCDADFEIAVAYAQCGQMVGAIKQELTATSDDARYIGLGQLVPVMNVGKLKIGGAVTGKVGNWQWKPTYRRYDLNRDMPGAWVGDLEASWRTGTGDFNTGELALSATGTTMWVEPGIMYSSSSGFGQATFSGSFGVRKA